MSTNLARLFQASIHDDGVNAWNMARFAAPNDLKGFIHGYTDYWERTAGFTIRRELPHAEGVFIVNLGDPIFVTGGDGGALTLEAGEAFVAGAHLRPAFSRSSGSQAGVHVFLPLTTLRLLLGTPMYELADRVVPLDRLLGASARRLGEALGAAKDQTGRLSLVDQALRQRLRNCAPLNRRHHRALDMLRSRPDLDICAIAAEVGWSRKHMAEQVRDAVGVGPRAFRRLLRFQALTRLIEGHRLRPDWAGLAVESGYYDQSHMIREFREFGGLTPSAFFSRSLPDGGGLVEA